MAEGVVIKEGWFYHGTAFGGECGDVYRPEEQRSPKMTLLVRHYRLVRGATGKVSQQHTLDALEFPDEAAMVAEIEARSMKELPPEADGNPQYVPPEFDPKGLAAAEAL